MAEPRQHVMSLKVTEETRHLVEQLAARLTINCKERHTLTDVIELAVRELAERIKVKT